MNSQNSVQTWFTAMTFIMLFMCLFAFTAWHAHPDEVTQKLKDGRTVHCLQVRLFQTISCDWENAK